MKLLDISVLIEEIQYYQKQPYVESNDYESVINTFNRCLVDDESYLYDSNWDIKEAYGDHNKILQELIKHNIEVTYDIDSREDVYLNITINKSYNPVRVYLPKFIGYTLKLSDNIPYKGQEGHFIRKHSESGQIIWHN